MGEPKFIYVLYNPETKSYVLDSGYYGNSFSILGFATKSECEMNIKFYKNSYKGFKARKMRIK